MADSTANVTTADVSTANLSTANVSTANVSTVDVLGLGDGLRYTLWLRLGLGLGVRGTG